MAFAAARTIAGTPLRARAVRRQAAKATGAVAAAQPSWFPGSAPPAHLDGSLPGDYGFDPLGLGKDPQELAWYVQAELVHARFAMLGSAGILIPAALTKVGLLNVPVWYEAGATKFEFADTYTLFIAQLFMMGFVEMKRYYDIKSPGSQGAEGSFAGLETGLGGTDKVGYPGGMFDPLGYASDAASLEMMKKKEIANGRLAMFSMLGYYGQAAATGAGPIDNWLTHISDPFHTTVASNKIAVPFL